MKTKEEILKVLRSIKNQLKIRYKIRALWMFGSIVRGDSTPLSDIDILVDFEDGADLFDLMALGDDLSEQLKQKVDVVPIRALRPDIQQQVFKEMAVV